MHPEAETGVQVGDRECPADQLLPGARTAGLGRQGGTAREGLSQNQRKAGVACKSSSAEAGGQTAR